MGRVYQFCRNMKRRAGRALPKPCRPETPPPRKWQRALRVLRALHLRALRHPRALRVDKPLYYHYILPGFVRRFYEVS
jgi:hypothetical protein